MAGREPASGRDLVSTISVLKSSMAFPRRRGAVPTLQSGRRFDLLPQPDPLDITGTADELDARFLEDLAQPPYHVGMARRHIVVGLEAVQRLPAYPQPRGQHARRGALKFNLPTNIPG